MPLAITLRPSDEEKALARSMAAVSAANPSHFSPSDYAQYYGYIGELVAKRYFGVLDSYDDSYDQFCKSDMVLNGWRFDIKTSVRTTRAELYYECPVAAQQIRGEVDAYLFVSVNKVSGFVELLGWKTKESFLDEARFVGVGESLGYATSLNDCYTLRFADLNAVDYLYPLAREARP